MEGHDEEYRYGQLYYYVPYQGRLSNIGKSFAHICPCVLKYNPNHHVKLGKYNSYDHKDIVLLSFLQTRCIKPKFHLVLYIPGESECRLYKENIIMFLRTRYCDPSAPFDEDSIKK